MQSTTKNNLTYNSQSKMLTVPASTKQGITTSNGNAMFRQNNNENDGCMDNNSQAINLSMQMQSLKIVPAYDPKKFPTSSPMASPLASISNNKKYNLPM